MRKLITLFFCLFVVIIVKAQTAIAPSSGNGSSGNPYQIATLSNLYWLAVQVNSGTDFNGVFFKQTVDIDASSTSTWFSGAGWTPIAGEFTDFSGSYDGQGHIVSGLYINRPTDNCVGFFGSVGTGTVQNLGLINLSITGKGNVGGLTGYLYNVGIVTNCYTTGTVVASYQQAGGLVGCSDNNAGNSTVSQCYSTCTITSPNVAGGLIGYNACQVSNCYFTGLINTPSAGGGLIGLNENGTVNSNCFWNSSVYATGCGTNNGGFSATGKTTAQMQTYSTYTGASWNFSTVWGYNAAKNNMYPYLLWQTVFNATLTTTAATTIGNNSATLGGNITDNGGSAVTERGIVYSSTNTKPIIGGTGVTKATNGTGTGSFSASIGSLTENTTYYVQAYAITSMGTSFGGIQTFTTLKLPTITTQAASSIGGTTATGNGNITNLGIPNPTAYGICWSTTSGAETATGNYVNNGSASSTGAFTAAITGLAGNTTYYVKAYATNTAGTSYGSEVSFTTLPVAPTVTTQAVSSIIATTATGNGNITSLGAPNPTAYGVCWSTTSGAETATGNHASNGSASATGAFTAAITGLTANTTYYTKAYATNTAGTSYGSEVSFTTLPVAPTVTTQAVSSIAATTATGNGNITSLGAPNPTAYGVCWNTTGTPTTSNSKADNGAASATGAFTASMTSLSANTMYHVRTFAINTGGTSYGTEVTFTTSAIAPTVTTQAVSSIAATTATGNGNITNLGVPNPTAYGVCWNTTGTPSTSDSKADNGAASATGAFTASITGLNANTTYHVRAYATNTAGTSYGTEVTFTTSAIAPTVTTQAVSSIAATTATGNGTITSLGVPNPTAYGVCYGTTANPDITGSKVDKGTASVTGAFTTTITGLTANTTYHVRAYATNTTGTVYGDEVTFVTQKPDITSATYATNTGLLSLTCTNITATDNINPTKITLTGEGGTIYTLTSTNTTATSSTLATIPLNPADKAAVNQIFNKNGTRSTDATLYNVAAADDWDASITAGDISDLTGNGITVSNVAIPTITGATYDATTGTLSVTGTGFLKLNGASNDINVSKFSIKGEGNATYTLTTADVEISSGTSFAITLNATDKFALTQIINKNGSVSNSGTAYNLAANEDWVAGMDPMVVVADLTGNGIIASNITAPSAPTIGIVTPENTQASISFTAPASNGGSAITGYTVVSSPEGRIGSGSSSPITVTGLTNGTAYTFTVTATNVVGTSVASAASNSVIPNMTQTITFTNPGAQNFGTSPTVSATTTSGLPVVFSTITPDVCSITSGGTLTFIKAGTCTILANQAGNTTYTAAPTISRTFTVNAIVSDAPTIGIATSGDAQASVNFTAPTFVGGSTITAYTVTASPGNLTATGTASPITITGLTNGTSYTFTVAAINSAGTSAQSAGSNSVTPIATQSITFANPSDQDFGTSPTLSATATSGLSVTFSTTTPDVCSITSGGTLTFIKAGTCTILAKQAGNTTYTAAPTISRTFTVNAIVSGAPTIGTATSGDAQARVNFTAPTFVGGSAITAYTVTASPGNLTATGTASPITITGLTNGTSYTFAIAAINSAGTSALSTASNSVTPFSAPIVTTDPASNITSTGATLKGTVATNGANTTVTFEYGTTTAYGTSVTATPNLVTELIGVAVSKVLTGLTANTTYHYRVLGINAGGSANGLDQTFKTDLGAGLENENVIVLSLYPNPTCEGFYINVGEKPTNVSIYDLSGSLVLTQQATGKSYVETNTLQQGVYVVKANGLVVKLVKK